MNTHLFKSLWLALLLCIGQSAWPLTQNNDSGQPAVAHQPMHASAKAAAFQPSDGTCYLIVHVKSGLPIKLNTAAVQSNVSNCLTIEAEGTPFIIAESGTGFTIYSPEDDEYVTTSGGVWSWNPGHSPSSSYAWIIEDAGATRTT